jgi:YVTN family beta-propeller protein
MGAQMRTFIIAFASFVLFATAAYAEDKAAGKADDAAKKAADTSPIVTKLEDDAHNNQQVLIQLKKNGIPQQMKIEDFCGRMNYGMSLFAHHQPITESKNVTATGAVGIGPRGVAVTPDGKFVYVANSGSNVVSVIATASNTVVATVAVGPNPAKTDDHKETTDDVEWVICRFKRD